MNKLYLNISEVSKKLDIREHVIRYWDSIDPNTGKIRALGLSTKNHKGKRYFNNHNIENLKKLKDILNSKRSLQSIHLINKLINNRNKSNFDKLNDNINTQISIEKTEKIMMILSKMRDLTNK